MEQVLRANLKLNPNNRPRVVWKYTTEYDKQNELPFAYMNISAGQEFQIDVSTESLSTTIKAIYTPGHTDDHVTYFLKEENALFTGDCVLGEGTSIFENLGVYMNSLNTLLRVIGDDAFNAVCILLTYFFLKINIKNDVQGPMVDDGKKLISDYVAHRNIF
jgi:glyoxylase-like metal-dependent hydrolase (beta-lactamase superfamily II)